MERSGRQVPHAGGTRVDDLEEWSRIAPEGDPLRRAYEEAQTVLSTGRLMRPIVTSAEKKKAIREMIALDEQPLLRRRGRVRLAPG